ncbi:MAG TPA: ankyrin repeat domain-containing protein [Thermomicrobiales bacterium]|nr:ankyrin repeat domain-containing protein [Thermomicrobiales bacterium]
MTADDLNQALIAAAWRNDADEAGRLIAQGADVNAKDETVQSAFLIATSEGFLSLLALTLENGADIDSRDSFDGTGLIRAAERGHALLVGMLLRQGIAVDHINNVGWTALLEAIILGDGGQRYSDTVRVLLAGGADPFLPSQQDGISPMDHAQAQGFWTIASTLFAVINSELPQDPIEALFHAASSNNVDGVMLALLAGADPNVQNAGGDTALAIAARAAYQDVSRLLHAFAGPI